MRASLSAHALAAFIAGLGFEAHGSSGEPQTGSRYLSLRADKVNMRTGPAEHYPIDWVFKRKGLPVEVTAAHDTWRKVRDWEGVEGWVHKSMLSDRRAMLVTGQVRSLRSDPKESAELVAKLEPGVVGRLERCSGEWCRATVAGFQGWLKRKEFWGVSPTEEFD